MQDRTVIVILGPTASGKSALGVQLAKKYHGVIISADSRQVYRGLDIGTAKITRWQMRGVQHYLLDVASPRGQYSVARFARDVAQVLQRLPAHQPVFLVGGSPFYIKTVTAPGSFSPVPPNAVLRRRLATKSTNQLINQLTDLDPSRIQSIDLANRRRLIRAIEIASYRSPPARPFSYELKAKRGGAPRATPRDGVVGALPPMRTLTIGIRVSRPELFRRIDRRVDKRLAGIIRETKKLHTQGLSWKRLDAFGLEYRFASRFLRGQLTRKQFTQQLKSAIHDFARRQETWWRRDKKIHWVSSASHAERLARRFL